MRRIPDPTIVTCLLTMAHTIVCKTTLYSWPVSGPTKLDQHIGGCGSCKEPGLNRSRDCGSGVDIRSLPNPFRLITDSGTHSVNAPPIMRDGVAAACKKSRRGGRASLLRN